MTGSMGRRSAPTPGSGYLPGSPGASMQAEIPQASVHVPLAEGVTVHAAAPGR